MVTIRKPCVAGTFYPAEPSILQGMVDKYLEEAKEFPFLTSPKAIIVPHAGYIYSGSTAATIYSILKKSREVIKKVVILGPAHRYPLTGIAATEADIFSTPLGNIAVDKEAIDTAVQLPFVEVIADAHQGEHCLEVQLPFLQTVLEDFKIAPFVVGHVAPEDTAQLIETLWGGEETLFVISSDLSHYYSYETAQKLDNAVTEAMVKLQPENIKDNQACGRYPIKGMLLAAKKHGLKVKKLELCNSGDTAGDKNRVVGYGAYYIG